MTKSSITIGREGYVSIIKVIGVSELILIQGLGIVYCIPGVHKRLTINTGSRIQIVPIFHTR